MANSQSIFNSAKPRTAAQWIILIAVTGVILTSPYGGKVVSGAIKEHLQQKARARDLKRKLDSKNISRALYELKRRRIIQVKTLQDGRVRILLTEKGRLKKLDHDIETIAIPRPKAWDKNWRFLIFDIPEEQRVARNNFREGLKRLGFVQFQQSVWIYPYSCEREVDFLAEFLEVNRFLTLLTVRVKDDRPLRECFRNFRLS